MRWRTDLGDWPFWGFWRRRQSRQGSSLIQNDEADQRVDILLGIQQVLGSTTKDRYFVQHAELLSF
tara:strand:+ start:84 stop:281 length:198 start_codon:yes stop_codon:yes gene_type:complete